MPTLYILCGLPFSGKTTWGKRIAERVGGLLISQDEIALEHHAQTGQWLEWAEGMRLMEQKAAQALRHGRSVICDSLYETRTMRDQAKAMAADCGATAVLYYLNTPLSVIQMRAQANEITQERHPFSPGGFSEIAAVFQVPEGCEGAFVVDPSADILDFRGVID
jgi:predicted kinase